MKGYPGALGEEAKAVGRLAEGAVRGVGRAAGPAIRAPAYMLAGTGGIGGGVPRGAARAAGQQGGVTSKFTPAPGVPAKSVALIQELTDLIEGGAKSIPKELRDRIRQDEYLKKINFKPPSLGVPGAAAQGRRLIQNPQDITVSVRTPEGELEEIPGFIEKPLAERKRIVRAGEYQDFLERQPRVPVKPEPPLIEPKVADEVPLAMNQRSSQASRAQNDPMPVEPNPPSLIDPESPEAFYRAFRERVDALPGDRITNEHHALLSLGDEGERLLAGAKIAGGDAEVERLQRVAGEGVVPDDAPPPNLPPEHGDIGEGSGQGNILGDDGKPPRKPPRRRRASGAGGGGGQRFGTIQVGGYSMPTLPDVEDMLAKMRHENTWQGIADKISGKYPALVRVVNAAGTLGTAPLDAKGMIAVEVLRYRIVTVAWLPCSLSLIASEPRM